MRASRDRRTAGAGTGLGGLHARKLGAFGNLRRASPPGTPSFWRPTGEARAWRQRSKNESAKSSAGTASLHFDLHPIPTATVDDLDMVRFEHEYLPGAFSAETLVVDQRTRTEQLAAVGMIASVHDPVPTVLGLLAMGKRPQDHIYGAYVQFLQIDGPRLTDDVIDAAEIGGVVPDLLRRLDDKLASHNRTPVDFASRFRGLRVSAYPIEALQQVVRNAVMHRSYEGTNAPVHVHWYADRIEVTSPGGPYGRAAADNFGEADTVDYRNPNLASAMKILGLVQRSGVGIALAKKRLADVGHQQPQFDVVGGNYVRVTVHGRASSLG